MRPDGGPAGGDAPAADRLAAACGEAGVALNLVAVAALWGQPHAYKPGDVPAWLAEAAAHPTGTATAAWAFTIVLALLVPVLAGLARRDAALAPGAILFAVGAILDAAGTLLPIAALRLAGPAAEAMLWATLLLDAAFNALLGLGLLLMALAMRPEAGWPRGLRWLALAAGVASVPVAGQAFSDVYAAGLLVSGPLWLAFVVWGARVLARPA